MAAVVVATVVRATCGDAGVAMVPGVTGLVSDKAKSFESLESESGLVAAAGVSVSVFTDMDGSDRFLGLVEDDARSFDVEVSEPWFVGPAVAVRLGVGTDLLPTPA
jgi:dihydrodipicolinate reductase